MKKKYLLLTLLVLLSLLSPNSSPLFADETIIETTDEQLPKVKADTLALSFAAYKPIYFLVGNPDSKLQFSFKTKILRSLDLHLAYSQLMLWQIFKKSAPMREVNYNPDLFYRLPVSTTSRDDWIDFGIYEHESNGASRGRSRSWNRSYLRYRSRTFSADGMSLISTFKVWIPYLVEGTSKDTLRYRGLWEINLDLAHFLLTFLEPGSLSFRFYPGGFSHLNPLQGGQELTLRAQSRWQQLLMPIVIQIFHGTGESLVDTHEEIWRLRAGIGF